MKKLLLLACTCLALGFVFAACGDDNNDSGDSGGGGASAPAQTTDDTSAGQDAAQVTMKDIQFDPKSVTVKKGGEVTWTNDDSVGHDVTSDAGGFKSGDAGGISQGQKFTEKFTKAGTFKYVCTVHPGMEGTVVVK